MISALRSLKFVFVPRGLVLGLVLAGCHDPAIELTPNPAAIPGVAIGPFTSGSASTTAPINVESVNNFSGFVNLSATCCQNVIRDLWESPAPGYVTWFFSTNPVNVPANGSAGTVLNIFMPALTSGPYANIGPNIPFGKHLIPVVGKSQSGNVSATANVGVTVLPSSEPAPGCKPGVEVIRLASGLPPTGTSPSPVTVGGILQRQIAAAEASPRTKVLNFVIYRATGSEVGSEAWKLTITDDTGLSSLTARVVLEHKSSKTEDKEVSTVGCSSLGKSVKATIGQTSVQMLLVATQDRTMYLRENVCANFLCTSRVWVDSIVFPEPAFWSVFGGKNVKFEWYECTPILLWCI